MVEIAYSAMAPHVAADDPDSALQAADAAMLEQIDAERHTINESYRCLCIGMAILACLERQSLSYRQKMVLLSRSLVASVYSHDAITRTKGYIMIAGILLPRRYRSLADLHPALIAVYGQIPRQNDIMANLIAPVLEVFMDQQNWDQVYRVLTSCQSRRLPRDLLDRLVHASRRMDRHAHVQHILRRYRRAPGDKSQLDAIIAHVTALAEAAQ